jgi:hypothetical protein
MLGSPYHGNEKSVDCIRDRSKVYQNYGRYEKYDCPREVQLHRKKSGDPYSNKES